MTILDRIVADTQEVVATRKAAVPPGQLEDMVGFDRDRRSLEDALRKNGPSIIAEVKKASPSGGVIRDNFRPVEIARQYEAGGAIAVSVLTEPHHFQGSLDDLAVVRQAISIPLLRKDFIIDTYQLVEARAYGADAVLLIAAVLHKTHLRDLLQAAHELDLDALVEVYEPRELDRLDFDETRIVGVNNRDLRTFEVDIEHSIRVFAEVPGKCCARVGKRSYVGGGTAIFARTRNRCLSDRRDLHAVRTTRGCIGKTQERSGRN